MNADLTRRIGQLEELVGNIVRVGKVSSVNDAAGTARVIFDDRDNVVSYDLPVMVRQSLKNKDYWLPDIGEQVTCVFLPSGVEAGFIIGSFYSTQESRPAASRDIRAIEFADGGRVEYNRDSSTLTVSGVKKVVVQATTSVTVDTPNAYFTGNVDITGLLVYRGGLAGSNSSGGGAAAFDGDVEVIGGDIKADGVSMKQHDHQGEVPPNV